MVFERLKVIYDENGKRISDCQNNSITVPEDLSEIADFDLAINEPFATVIHNGDFDAFVVIVPFMEGEMKRFSLHIETVNSILQLAGANLDNLIANSISVCRTTMQNIAGLSARLSSVLDDAELYDEKQAVSLQIKNCYRLLRSTKNIEELYNYLYGAVNNKPFFPSEIIIPSCKVAQMLLADTNKKINVNVKDEPVVLCDPKRFENAFLNVLTNALMYSADEANITVTLESSNGKAVVTVSDDGYGMSMAKAEKALMLGVSFSEKNDKQGLGLYLAKRFTDSAKGSIMIMSKENVGTTVTMSIPITQEEAVSLETNFVDYFSRLFSPVEVAICDVVNRNLLNLL